MNDKTLWMIWQTPYQSYAHEAKHGIAAPHIVAGPFRFSEAISKAELLGFGYCVKPV